MKIIDQNGSIVESTFEEELGRHALRHTASHILAQAVKRLYPDTPSPTASITISTAKPPSPRTTYRKSKPK